MRETYNKPFKTNKNSMSFFFFKIKNNILLFIDSEFIESSFSSFLVENKLNFNCQRKKNLIYIFLKNYKLVPSFKTHITLQIFTLS